MSARKIILVKINRPEYMHIPPLGLLYVGGALKKAGYQVEILHISTREVGAQVGRVVEERPLFVGFSVFTGEAMRSYASMCRGIKVREPGIPIVWGNAHPSLLPRECLEEPYIDIVVIGEGEVTAVELAKALENGGDLSQVKGIGYKRDGEIVLNEPRPFIHDLDDYSMDWSLVEVERYIQPFGETPRVLQFVTSRGCPHRCGFCYNARFNERRWRAHSVEFVVREIEALRREHDIQGIQFWDDNFFVDRTRAFEILERLRMPYYAEGRLDYIDEDFARRLAETACVYLLTGVESGSDRILQLIHKDLTVEGAKQAIRNLAKYPKVWVSGSVIFAYPTETEGEFRETIRLMAELLEIKPDMVFTSGFYMPYPGSDLYELAIKEGFDPPGRTEDWEDLDRWVNRLEITWVDWISSFDTARIRENILLLAALYRHDIPFLKGWTKREIVERAGELGPLLRALARLYVRVVGSEGGVLNRTAGVGWRMFKGLRSALGRLGNPGAAPGGEGVLR